MTGVRSPDAVASVAPLERPPQLRARSRSRQRVFAWAVLAAVLAFLVVPLFAMLIFSLRHPLSGRWSLDPWVAILTGSSEAMGTDMSILWEGLGASLGLCVLTVALMLVLLLPAMLYARLHGRGQQKLVEFISLLPLTIPAIVLVVGLAPIYRFISANLLSTDAIWLCFAYVILVLPYSYRALAGGLATIDVPTLVEAARSLGASWLTVTLRVIVPNLWQAITSACFVTIAVVMGEYTVASLLGRVNLQVAIYQLGQSNSQLATAMALLAMLAGVALLVALDLISQRMRKGGKRR